MPPEEKDLERNFTRSFPHFLELLETDPDAAVTEFADMARRWLPAHPSPSMQALSTSEKNQVVEETIKRCLRKEAEPLRNYTDHGAPFGDWLSRVAEDTCAKRTRRNQQPSSPAPPASGGTANSAGAEPRSSTASDRPDERVLARIVWEYIRDLKDPDRRIALLGFGDGLKQPDLVQLLGYRHKRDATAKMYAKLKSGKEELAGLLKSLDYHREDIHRSEKNGTETADGDDLGWLDEWLRRAARHTPDIAGFVRPLNDAIDAYITGTDDRNERIKVQDALVRYRDFRQEVLERAHVLAKMPTSEILEHCDSLPAVELEPAKSKKTAAPKRTETSKVAPPVSRPIEPTKAAAPLPGPGPQRRVPQRVAPGRPGVLAFLEWLRTPRVLAPVAAVAVLVAVISLQSRFGRGTGPGSRPAASYPDQITASFVTEAEVARSAYDLLPLPPLATTPGETGLSSSTIVFRSARYVVLHLSVDRTEDGPNLSTLVIENDAGESVWEETLPAEFLESENLYLRIDPNSFRPGDYTVHVSNAEAAVVVRSAFKIAD
jgi:hypothetical protein